MALRLVLEASEGRQPKSALCDAVLDRLGSPASVVAFAAEARPSDFGGLAPMITEAAQNSDVLALLAMQAGAVEIMRSLTSLGWDAGTGLCLTGGIGPHYARFLRPDVQTNLREPHSTPLEGAIALAKELAT